MKLNKLTISLLSAGLVSTSALATNGMNMEGYGPISTAMGGTNAAFNVGTAGMINNPATLAMMPQGSNLELALAILGPDVSASMGTYKAESSATSFLMPGVGYVRHDGKMAYGVGVMAQGGMGADYGKATATGNNLFMMGNSMMNPTPTSPDINLSGESIRSEVAVMRVIAPFAYQVNDQLNVGATLDWVKIGMDLQMDMDGAGFRDLAYSNPNTFTRTGLVSGTMLDGFESNFNNGAISNANYMRFDFSDDSDWSQKTSGSGIGFKLGATYAVSSSLTVGFGYHPKTDVGDLEGDATLKMSVQANQDLDQNGTTGTEVLPVTGKIKVKDFDWPSQMNLGVAFKAMDNLLVTADYTSISWSSVMDKFSMEFTAANTAANGGFAGKNLAVEMQQNWDDQSVIKLGAAYTMDALTLRVGANMSSNPVPKTTINPLFPATIENHYTLGGSYDLGSSQINASYSIAPEVAVTSSTNSITSKHSQANMQVSYLMNF